MHDSNSIRRCLPAIRVLNRRADVVAGDRYTATAEFDNRFAAFTKAFEEEGFDEGFLRKPGSRSYIEHFRFWAASETVTEY